MSQDIAPLGSSLAASAGSVRTRLHGVLSGLLSPGSAVSPFLLSAVAPLDSSNFGLCFSCFSFISLDLILCLCSACFVFTFYTIPNPMMQMMLEENSAM